MAWIDDMANIRPSIHSSSPPQQTPFSLSPKPHPTPRARLSPSCANPSAPLLPAAATSGNQPPTLSSPLPRRRSTPPPAASSAPHLLSQVKGKKGRKARTFYPKEREWKGSSDKVVQRPDPRQHRRPEPRLSSRSPMEARPDSTHGRRRPKP